MQSKRYLGFFLLFCSCDQMTLQENQKTGSGEVSINGSKSTETNDSAPSLNLDLSSVQRCRRDKKSGLIEIELSDADNIGSISIMIRGSKSESERYTCEQSNDNRKSTEDLGDMFESCMVEVSVPSAIDPKNRDNYAMCRTHSSYPLFRYRGDCSVAISKLQPKLEGRFSCEGLVQVTSNSVAIAAVDPASEKEMEGSFSCQLE